MGRSFYRLLWLFQKGLSGCSRRESTTDRQTDSRRTLRAGAHFAYDKAETGLACPSGDRSGIFCSGIMLSVQFTQGSKIRDTSSRVKQLPAANTFSVVIAPMMISVPREGSEELDVLG